MNGFRKCKVNITIGVSYNGFIAVTFWGGVVKPLWYGSRNQLRAISEKIILDLNFKNMKRLLLAIFVLCFPMTQVWAVKVASLYQAELPVSTQSAEARAEATKLGFIQVLVKVTGDQQIDKNPLIIPSLERADYFVQEFSYSASTTASSQYQILINYNADDINRLLKKAGVVYWGGNRPLILVWLAFTNKKNETNIIGNEDPGDLLNAMKQESKKYGIPLIFPMMDVTEMDEVSANDIDEWSIPLLKKASKRYAPDAFLIGKIDANGDGYESEWELILGKNQWSWTVSDKTTNGVVGILLNQISQTLSKHYVIKIPNAPEWWLKLQVSNITQRDDLAQLMRYLNQLSSVLQVRLSQVAGDVVELSILVRGSLTSFQKNAGIGQRLVLKAEDKANDKLIYEWVH